MKKFDLKLAISLFLTFFKIGAFTFGGGYAMIPLIKRETVENKGFISEDVILEIVAIAESTPGPIAINAATFVGQRTMGFFGALAATLGIVLPSFAIITVIAVFLKEFSHLKPVKYAFKGISAAVPALIFTALVSMGKKALDSIFSVALAVLAFVAVLFFDVSAIAVMIICAVLGVLYHFARQKGKKRDTNDIS